MKFHSISAITAVMLLAGALSGCGSSASAPVRELETESEVQDGSVADVAAAEDATIDPDGSRVWVAQGRVRAAFRASTRERMTAEDETFPPGDAHHENLVAIEVDDAGEFLYTLTDSALYRETFAPPFSQSAPGGLVRLPLTEGLEPPLIVPEEIVRDVKVINAQWCAVLTSRRILVIESLPQSLEVRSHTTELLTVPLRAVPPDPDFDRLQISGLRKMTVARDDTQQYIAYCRAEIREFPDAPSISMVDREPQVLLLCRLGTPEEGFANPTFDTDPTDGVSFSYWDPFSAEPAYAGESDELVHHTLNDVEVRVLDGETRVYCACGRAKQLRELHASFGPGNGVRPLSTITLDPQENLHRCKHDPSIPDAGTLYVYGTTRFFSVDLASPTNFTQVDHEPFDSGGRGDCVFVRLGDVTGVTPTVWTEGAQVVDNVCKVFDVGGATPAIYSKYGGLWESDGAVATDADDVYLPTMGAVTRYHRTNGVWTAGKTQGNEVPAGSGIVYNTESIDLGRLGPGDTRLFTAGNTGTSSGPVEMRLDANGDPGLPDFLDPANFLAAAGWDPVRDHVYTNDVQYQDDTGTKLVLFDMANLSRHQAALVADRWEPIPGYWVCAGYGLVNLPGDGFEYTNAICTGDGLDGREFAFVADGAGLFSVNLTPLAHPTASIQSLSVPSNLAAQTDPILDHAGGIATSGDRLFVFYDNGPQSHGPAAPPAICVYRWDRTTGEIWTPPEALYRPDSSKSRLFIPHYGRTWRLRFHADPGGGFGGKLYDSSDARLFQITYDPSIPADPLRYTAVWKSDYDSYLQDSRVYDFGDGPRLLVVKGLEGFAFVKE